MESIPVLDGLGTTTIEDVNVDTSKMKSENSDPSSDWIPETTKTTSIFGRCRTDEKFAEPSTRPIQDTAPSPDTSLMTPPTTDAPDENVQKQMDSENGSQITQESPGKTVPVNETTTSESSQTSKSRSNESRQMSEQERKVFIIAKSMKDMGVQ
ncbi:hypothetical protein BD410DRAFT_211552 [Rickenella mellea]|uniref:Uncharacterized protein n=1 Tax=Rickenella mellea TaxID=50990 RepID=A0A4Y7Q5Q5_9AGAM|nr:hypothetical protein BD410DRAFT_211552 [Rickenella mellea]